MKSSMSLSIAKFPVLIWYLYLGDEVQLFYLHMNMGLQQLVKKPLGQFFFSRSMKRIFDLILFSFCLLFLEADPPLAVGYVLFFFIFKGFHICLKAFQYFRFEGCKNPKTFLIKFVGTFLARFV